MAKKRKHMAVSKRKRSTDGKAQPAPPLPPVPLRPNPLGYFYRGGSDPDVP